MNLYPLLFGFRQKCSITHALIHLIDKIRDEIDRINYACGIFADFQKALLKKIKIL